MVSGFPSWAVIGVLCHRAFARNAWLENTAGGNAEARMVASTIEGQSEIRHSVSIEKEGASQKSDQAESICSIVACHVRSSCAQDRHSAGIFACCINALYHASMLSGPYLAYQNPSISLERAGQNAQPEDAIER